MEIKVKSHGSMEGVYINGAPQGIMFHENDEFTLYPASILSVNKNRFTKHYFIGNQRIASRIGSGRFNNVYGLNGSYVTAGQQDYAERMNQIEVQREEYYKKQGIAPGVPTMKGAYGDPENTGVGYNTIITELGDHSVPANWAQYVIKKQPGETPGPPIIWGEPESPEEAEPGYGYIADKGEDDEETFYYHSDHLGSTSYITDKEGNVTQYISYLPYGELLVDEHSSSEEMPYKFNGKELDEETGLYYYGARYMQPVASIWYGVDQLTEKYASVSGYTYCLGNPIRLVDGNGKEVYLCTETKGTGHTFVVITDKNTTTVYTYGRYQGGNWYTVGTTGEGVLVRYNGENASEYIKNELYKMEANFYQIKDANTCKVKQYFDNQFEKSNIISTTNNKRINENGKVVDTYSLFGNNCTTKSCDAIKYGDSSIFDVKGMLFDYDEDFTIPESLQKYLTNLSNLNGST